MLLPDAGFGSTARALDNNMGGNSKDGGANGSQNDTSDNHTGRGGGGLSDLAVSLHAPQAQLNVLWDIVVVVAMTGRCGGGSIVVVVPPGWDSSSRIMRDGGCDFLSISSCRAAADNGFVGVGVVHSGDSRGRHGRWDEVGG